MYLGKKFITSLTCLLLISGCAKTDNEKDIPEPEPQVDTAALEETQSDEVAVEASEGKVKDITVVPESYEDAYSEVLDNYYYELMNPETYDSDYRLFRDGNTITIYAHKDKNGGALDYAGYGFIDLTGDGIKELIIGNLSDVEELDKMIFCICSLKNNFPESIIGFLCDDTNLYICEGEKVVTDTQKKYDFYNERRLYKDYLSDNGYEEISIVMDKLNNGKVTCKFVDEDKNETEISEEEANKEFDEYKSRIIQPDLTPFSKYTPKKEKGYYDDYENYEKYDYYWTHIFGKGFSSWQEGYNAWLTEYEAERAVYSLDYLRYNLIYVDDDDIPELVVVGQCEADESVVLSYHDGMVSELTTGWSVSYVEKQNRLNCGGGKQGLYFDPICCLENGRWKRIFDGKYWANSSDFEYDENLHMYIVDNYSVNGDTNYNLESYLEALSKVYDRDSDACADGELTYEELMKAMNE